MTKLSYSGVLPCVQPAKRKISIFIGSTNDPHLDFGLGIRLVVRQLIAEKFDVSGEHLSAASAGSRYLKGGSEGRVLKVDGERLARAILVCKTCGFGRGQRL